MNMNAFLFTFLCALSSHSAFAQTVSANPSLPSSSISFQWQTPNDPPVEPFSFDDIVLKANGNVSASVILRGWEGCDAADPCKPDQNKRRLIKAGFEEMQKMIPNGFNDAPDPSDPPVNRYEIEWNSAAAVEFWGSWSKTRDYRNLVQDNMNSLAAQVSGDWFGWTLNVRCDDPGQACTPNTEAYTMHGEGMDDHINFCDRYFKLSSLDIAVDTQASKGDSSERDNLYKYWNRVWAHELMHHSRIGKVAPIVGTAWMTDIMYGRPSSPKRWKIYRPVDAKWLAAGQASPAYGASHNPQNYALFALANYVVRRRALYPSVDVWDSTMEPPRHPVEGATGSQFVSDVTVGPDLQLRC